MLLMHPITYRWFLGIIESQSPKVSDLLAGTSLAGKKHFAGVDVRPHHGVPRWRKKWVFPTDPHFEYEPSDEVWCRYFEIGHEEVDTSQPMIVEINATTSFSIDPKELFRREKPLIDPAAFRAEWLNEPKPIVGLKA